MQLMRNHTEDESTRDGPLERLRQLCLALPETTERLSHGEPTWFVRGKKTFVMYADHHHDDRLAFWCAAPEGAQDILVTAAPDRFFVPPYVGALQNSFEPGDNAFDLGAEHLKAAAVDHVFFPIEHTDKTVGVHRSDVPRAPEAVDEFALICGGS